MNDAPALEQRLAPGPASPASALSCESVAPPRLIECVGLPGAGKTSLAAALLERLGGRMASRKSLSADWRSRPALERIAWAAAGLCDRGTALPAARLLAGARASRDSRARLARLLVKRGWLGGQVVPILLDQGPLQELWSILCQSSPDEPEPALLGALIEALYRGSGARILYLDIEPALAASRVAGRIDGHSRIDPLGPADALRALEEGARLLDHLLSAARAAGLRIERLDASMPLDELTERVRAMLFEPAEPGRA